MPDILVAFECNGTLDADFNENRASKDTRDTDLCRNHFGPEGQDAEQHSRRSGLPLTHCIAMEQMTHTSTPQLVTGSDQLLKAGSSRK